MRRKNRAGSPPSKRQVIFNRARGRCEFCHQPVGRIWEDHHVFLKSLTDAHIHDELWNRVCLHNDLFSGHGARRCHDLAHKQRAVRETLEEIAIKRLQAYVPPQVWQLLLRKREGETNAAIVRAYERYRRGEFFTDDLELEEMASNG